MQALIKFFVELALLRRRPQDLPASPVLLLLFAVLNVVLGAANGAKLFGGFGNALGANLIDLLFSMLVLFALLQIRGHPRRWLQTTSAFLGLGVLAGILMTLVQIPVEAVGTPGSVALLNLVLIIWLHLALGGVLRHALEVPLALGVVIVLAYTVMSFTLIARIYPPVTST